MKTETLLLLLLLLGITFIFAFFAEKKNKKTELFTEKQGEVSKLRLLCN